MKETLFKQTWWVRLAVVLAVLQVVFPIGAGTDSEETGLRAGDPLDLSSASDQHSAGDQVTA